MVHAQVVGERLALQWLALWFCCDWLVGLVLFLPGRLVFPYPCKVLQRVLEGFLGSGVSTPGPWLRNPWGGRYIHLPLPLWLEMSPLIWRMLITYQEYAPFVFPQGLHAIALCCHLHKGRRRFQKLETPSPLFLFLQSGLLLL